MKAPIRSLLGALAGLAAVAAAGQACAQASASQNTTGSVVIFQPIALAKNSDLNFGIVVRPLSGSGNVTINASTGVRTADSGVGLLERASGPYQATRATYTVTGEGGQTFTVGIPVSFNMTGPGSPITVTLSSSVTGGTATTGTLSNALGSTGTQTFGVGGTLTVSTATTNGSYSGTFSVTVNYN